MTAAERALQRRAAEAPTTPALSMPAAETFGTWAVAEAVRESVGERPRAAVAIGDCDPAAAALNAASS
eukprot:3377744-Pleurochrysis_carterae.AAC.1